MKKILFLFLCIIVVGCTSVNSSSSSDVSESSSSSTSSDYGYVEEKENIEIIEVKNNEVKALIEGKEFIYKADIIIDGKEYKASEVLYLNDKEKTNNFLVINGGKLILEETTVVKKGNTSGDTSLLRYGQNACILAIGKESKVEVKSVAINIFDSFSTGIHCMGGASAEINNLDLLVVSDFSHALSTYQEGKVIANYLLVLIDSDQTVAFAIYENDGLIHVKGNNNYIEVHGTQSYVGILFSGILRLENMYGYSENSKLFEVDKNALLSLDDVLIQES